jgi:hypothetical protein
LKISDEAGVKELFLQCRKSSRHPHEHLFVRGRSGSRAIVSGEEAGRTERREDGVSGQDMTWEEALWYFDKDYSIVVHNVDLCWKPVAKFVQRLEDELGNVSRLARFSYSFVELTSSLSY